MIAPEEIGRGVRGAGAGRYFDTLAASGQPIQKGRAAWPHATIRIVEVPIRDGNGLPRTQSEVIADLQHEIEKALAQHRRVLLNLLPASKTGLNAPSEEAVIELLQLAPNSIDVVVDACQLRSPFVKMGDWVRQGWMVQLSGSKFLTGPPFSGTLIIPRHLRSRVSNISVLLDRAPTVGSKQDWSAWWRDHFSVLPHEDVTSLE